MRGVIGSRRERRRHPIAPGTGTGSELLRRRWIELLREWRDEALQQRAWQHSLRAEAETDWVALAGRQHFALFPRREVESCRFDVALQAAHDAGLARVRHGSSSRACFGCGRPAEALEWIFFQSALWTWTQQCGRAGWIVYCPHCDNQVCFHRSRMS